MPRSRCVCGEMVCASGCRVWARAGVVAPVAQPGKNTPGAQAHGRKGEARQSYAPHPCFECCAWGAEALIGWRTGVVAAAGCCCCLVASLLRSSSNQGAQGQRQRRTGWLGLVECVEMRRVSV